MLRFADDITLLGDEKKELEEVLNGMEQILLRIYNMKVIKKKTKVMVRKRNGEYQKLDISLDSAKVDEVKEFFYLGNEVTKDIRSKINLKCRIVLRKTFP